MSSFEGVAINHLLVRPTIFRQYWVESWGGSLQSLLLGCPYSLSDVYGQLTLFEANDYSTGLNAQQLKALREVSTEKPLTVIEAPPGTGKTTFLIKAVQALTDNYIRVCIAVPQNDLVDEYVSRLGQAGITGVFSYSENQTAPPSWTKVVISTVDSVARTTSYQFSALLIDEAGLLTVGQLIGACRASRSMSKLVLVGDREQGSPFCYVRQLRSSLIDTSCICAAQSASFRTIQLNEQYRMPRDYGLANSRRVYGWTIDNPLSKADSLIRLNSFPGAVEVGSSWSNSKEAEWAIGVYQESTLASKVIICYYQAQVNYIHAMDPSINIYTVDSIQGREWDLVIVLTTRMEATPLPPPPTAIVNNRMTVHF